MKQPRLTDRAEADLEECWLHIARDDPCSATRFIETILEKCELLAEQPGIGRRRGDLSPDLRSFVVGRYLILYRPIDDGIEVVRVLHGARNIEVLLKD
jgi:toxin ParE1/3/4